jgi:hypothetical protein
MLINFMQSIIRTQWTGFGEAGATQITLFGLKIMYGHRP